MKDETFHVEKGLVYLELDGKGRFMRPGDTAHIPPGTPHRFNGLEESVILEVSTHHEDDDCLRDEPSGPVPKDLLEDLLLRARR